MARRPTAESAWSFCHGRQLVGRMNNRWLQLARDFGGFDSQMKRPKSRIT